MDWAGFGAVLAGVITAFGGILVTINKGFLTAMKEQRQEFTTHLDNHLSSQTAAQRTLATQVELQTQALRDLTAEIRRPKPRRRST